MSVPRVAYLLSRYPGVSQTFVQREIQGLRGVGVEVETFSVRRPGPEDVLSESDRREHAATVALLPTSAVRVVRAHLRGLLSSPVAYVRTLAHAVSLRGPGLRSLAWQVFYFGEAILFWAECRRRDLRHVHVHFANPAADVAMLATRFGGREWGWSLTMHGPAELSDVRGHRLQAKVQSLAFAACTTNFIRSQLLIQGGPDAAPKLALIRTGIDIAAFPPVTDRPAGDGSLRLLNVGRLAPVKAQWVLIEAVAELVRRGRDVRATLVGPGPEFDALQGYAARLGVADRVTLTGAVGQDEIQRHFEAADLFCLPSFAEGLPLVIIEAMAKGLPVITTNVMGISDLVEHERTGLIVPPGRPDLLVAAIERLAGDAALREDLRRNARARIEAEYDVRTTSLQLRERLLAAI